MAPLRMAVPVSGSRRPVPCDHRRRNEEFNEIDDGFYTLGVQPLHPASSSLGWREDLAPAPLPERLGRSPCTYFLRTGHCGFGSLCKFDHPCRTLATSAEAGLQMFGAPVNLLPLCLHDDVGVNGTHHHEVRQQQHQRQPQQQQGRHSQARLMPSGNPTFIPTATRRGVSEAPMGSAGAPLPPATLPRSSDAAKAIPFSAAISAAQTVLSYVEDATSLRISHPGMPLPPQGGAYGTPAPLNCKGFPLRPKEPDCPYYIKNAVCKFGAMCKFNHPESSSGAGSSGVTMPGEVALSRRPSELADMWMATPPSSDLHPHFPLRPGQPACPYYLKTGTCKFGMGCRFHHPLQRTGSLPAVELTHAGLPRREGQLCCPYYMKTGACGYGSGCKFNHPTPGEAAAQAAAKFQALTDIAKNTTSVSMRACRA
eukprot:jgi/Mesen1/8632/ME000050S08043